MVGIMVNADGGCSTCAGELVNMAVEAFPEQRDAITAAWHEQWEYPLKWEAQAPA